MIKLTATRIVAGSNPHNIPKPDYLKGSKGPWKVVKGEKGFDVVDKNNKLVDEGYVTKVEAEKDVSRLNKLYASSLVAAAGTLRDNAVKRKAELKSRIDKVQKDLDGVLDTIKKRKADKDTSDSIYLNGRKGELTEYLKDLNTDLKSGGYKGIKFKSLSSTMIKLVATKVVAAKGKKKPSIHKTVTFTPKPKGPRRLNKASKPLTPKSSVVKAALVDFNKKYKYVALPELRRKGRTTPRYNEEDYKEMADLLCKVLKAEGVASAKVVEDEEPAPGMTGDLIAMFRVQVGKYTMQYENAGFSADQGFSQAQYDKLENLDLDTFVKSVLPILIKAKGPSNSKMEASSTQIVAAPVDFNKKYKYVALPQRNFSGSIRGGGKKAAAYSDDDQLRMARLLAKVLKDEGITTVKITKGEDLTSIKRGIDAAYQVRVGNYVMEYGNAGYTLAEGDTTKQINGAINEDLDTFVKYMLPIITKGAK